jgi:dynein heavy chain
VPESIGFNELLIPTVDNTRNSYMINMLVSNKKHMLINGQTGTGKTVNIIKELNYKFMNENYTNFQTSFSGQTSETQVQRLIETKINTKRRRGYYYPGKDLRIFCF